MKRFCFYFTVVVSLLFLSSCSKPLPTVEEIIHEIIQKGTVRNVHFGMHINEVREIEKDNISEFVKDNGFGNSAIYVREVFNDNYRLNFYYLFKDSLLIRIECKGNVLNHDLELQQKLYHGLLKEMRMSLGTEYHVTEPQYYETLKRFANWQIHHWKIMNKSTGKYHCLELLYDMEAYRLAIETGSELYLN